MNLRKSKRPNFLLPASCREDDNTKAWVIGGAAAVAAAIGIAVAASGDDGGSGNGGGDGSGGDGGDGSGGDGGDGSGGDGGDGSGGDGGDGSGGDGGDGSGGDGGKTGITTYSNGAVLDRDAGTLTIATVNTGDATYNNVKFTYQQIDGGWLLTAEDGRTLTVTDWQVTNGNALTLFGTQGDKQLGWIYDRAGDFTWGNADSLSRTGDNNNTTITSGIDVDQRGQAGVLILGDVTTTQINAGANVSNGGTGVKVEGDDAALTLSDGADFTVGGAGSTGVDISGDRAKVQADGDLNVSGGATGIAVKGADTLLSNGGNITVTDSGSVGVLIAGDHTVFSNKGTINSSLNGTGMAITGDNAQVDLNGALNVNLVANGDGIPQGATGLSISGNSAKVTMKGDVAIAGSLNNSSGLPLSLLGVSVSGDNNAVDIGGSVNISLDYTTPDSINAQAAGITVDGGNNTVTIAGGLNMNYADGRSSDRNGENDGLLAGVKVNGDNTLKIKGNSSFTMQGMPGDKATFAQVSGGGHLILEKDSTLGVSFTSVYRNDSGHQSVISATGEGSSADNYGIINSNAADTTLLQAASGAVVTNHGTITGKVSAQGGSWGIVESYAGSAAINASGGSINLTNSYTPEYGTALTDLPIRGHLRTSYAMLSGFSSTSSTLLNAEGGEINLQGAGLYGMGLTKGTGTNAGTINLDGFTPTFDDEGNVTDKEVWTGYIAARGAGIVTGSDEIGGASASATNTGTINVNNEGFGMLALNGGTVTNQGTINLTSDEGVERTTDNQLVGIGVIGGTAINDKTGVINIQGNVGQAFYNNGSGTIINYGQVCIDGTCQGPTDNNAEANNASRTQPDAPAGANNLQGYVVGTNTDGSAGKLMVSNASMQGVSVNTGFTSGTDATSVTFNDVVQGNNLTDATAIQSTSVVWNAKGSTDAAGNVDVTMTKKAYADAAGDSSVAGVAGALDAAYTNNALFNSLNVGTSAELSSALKQISGAGASSAGRDARILSNRFTMLADSAPQMPNGLSFNVVAKGDQRAELSNNTRYDMMALGQKFALGGNQTLSVQYGMARLDGNGARNAGDNGLTGGYSQFLGFDHALPLGDEGLMLNNSLRYDIHNLDTRRSISYGDVNATAKSGNREQYLELRSTAGKTLQWQEGLDVTPYAGLKLRHTLSDGYGEHGAGDFNLKMSNGSETALDSIAGVKLSYAGKDGWAVTASLEGGPNLSYAQSQRKASLQGAAGQSFNVNSGEKGGGFNGQATLGVKYNGKAGALQLDAFQWKEDGISDKGLMFNLKKTF